MITREISHIVIELSKTYPVVTITGPRQSGKTTLCKQVFSHYTYCNLEHPDTRELAENDPNAFFNRYNYPLIIDEIQRVPNLLSYIQVKVDDTRENGMYVLTGSQQLSLNASISQSLAGRTALLSLLPFSQLELKQYTDFNNTRDNLIYTGFLPRIYDQGQLPTIAYRSYLQTYIERDMRQLINVKNLSAFSRFIHLLAGRIGQVLNQTSLANDTGVSVPTINEWLSILEASFIIYRLLPYYNNFGKRVIKSPKIYFTETGLAAYLLGIENVNQVSSYPLIGSLFENMVVMDIVKNRLNKGMEPNLYYYRDTNNLEIDLIATKGSNLIPIEIKSAMTWNNDFQKAISNFRKFVNNTGKGFIVYAGELEFENEKNSIINFQNNFRIFEEHIPH